jgi:hypothetical protein
MGSHYEHDRNVPLYTRIVCVSQMHPFRFIFQTAEKKTIPAKITLLNAVWDEQDNMRDGHQCRRAFAGGSLLSATLPSISIWRPRKKNQKYYRHLVLEPIRHHHFSGEDDDWGEERYGGYWEDPDAAEDLKFAMVILWKCAQRIAVYPDGTTYPSAEYIMHALPSALHEHFPPTATLVANSSRPVDRKTVVELSYRPSRSRAEWMTILPRRPRRKAREYSWFSDDEDSEEEQHPAKISKAET